MHSPKLPYLLIAPAFALLAFTVALPIATNLNISLHEFNSVRSLAPTKFVGLANFARLLTDEHFWGAMKVTTAFTILAVALEFVLGFLLALLMQNQLAGGKLIRTLLITPILATPLIVGLMFRLMYHGEYGIVTYLIQINGFPDFLWLTDPVPAFFAILIAEVWHNTSFVFLVLFSAMVVLPKEPYEAAEVDGASYWQQVRHLTFPLLAPAILVALMFRLVFTIRLFEQVYVITKGGPNRATETVSMLLYSAAFRENDMGAASSLAIVLTILTLILATGLVKILYRGAPA